VHHHDAEAGVFTPHFEKKNVKVDDVNCKVKIEMEKKVAALDTYQRMHQDVAETDRKNVEALGKTLSIPGMHYYAEQPCESPTR
jgi:hypothetical protein